MIGPMVRNNICLNAHPEGCAAGVRREIAYVKSKGAIANGPKKVLVLGCSTGYGLSSRVSAAFGCGAATIGVSFEREGTETKSGTPGWYNNRAFDEEAKKAGLFSETFNADAFSDETRAKVIDRIKAAMGTVDLVVYSLASPVRQEPGSGILWRSVIKPVGKEYSGTLIDMVSGKMTPTTIAPATEEEIQGSVKVMGGEDWILWIKALKAAGALSAGAKTVAYSYIGPALSAPIYRSGTIGRAKEHIEASVKLLNQELSGIGGSAFISVNKAVVTRASAVIPGIPLYVMSLFKVMKGMGIHEGCPEQIYRLYRERLYTADGKVPVDAEGRVRIDDWEMRQDVQAAVDKLMAATDESNLKTNVDFDGVREDFLQAHGFDMPGVDYDKPVSFA